MSPDEGQASLLSDRPGATGAGRAASPRMTWRGCLLASGLWLIVMTLPCCALVLAVRQEVTWRRGDFVEDRLWIVRGEAGPGRQAVSGLGYSAARVISDQRPADGPVCVRTRVYFLLWRGQSERVEFCECFTPRPAPGGGFEASGSCP